MAVFIDYRGDKMLGQTQSDLCSMKTKAPLGCGAFALAIFQVGPLRRTQWSNEIQAASSLETSRLASRSSVFCGSVEDVAVANP